MKLIMLINPVAPKNIKRTYTKTILQTTNLHEYTTAMILGVLNKM